MSPETARSELMALLWANWSTVAAAAGLTTDTLPVQWPGQVVTDVDALANSFFARVSIQELTSRQSTLNTVGNRRLRRTNQISVQMFAPLSSATPEKFALLLATAVGTVIGGTHTASGLWTKAPLTKDVGRDLHWVSKTSVTQFEFDELF